MSAESFPIFGDKNELSIVSSSNEEATEDHTISIEGQGNLDPDNLEESLIGLIVPAYCGYIATVTQINSNRRRTELISIPRQENLEDEFIDWFDEPRSAYTAEMVKKYPHITWSLLATPNVAVTETQFLGSAIKFGSDQPSATEISHDNIIEKYNPKEISGTNPKNGKAFKLKLVALALSHENVDLPKLRALRGGKSPYLESASPLESINWLNTLRYSGYQLFGDGTQQATYIPSLALEPKYSVDGWRIPSLHIMNSGALVVGSSTIFETDDTANQSIRDGFSLDIRPVIS